MKTEVISVSSKGQGMDAALALADRTAEQLGCSHREALHLRLLVEEMMNMMCSIIGELEGKFWIETENDKAYRLVLQMKTLMDSEQRAQLLSASTSGKNEAHRGLMGKLRAFFEPMPIEDTPSYLAGTIVRGNANDDLTWSLEAYRERLRNGKDASDEAREEWDELEKSVVSHIADNVTVSIRNYDVEMMIYKKLGQ
jgi:hypothetical protein